MARYNAILITVLLVCVSASVHEFGHALAAHLLGDDTAKEQGRLTLNPLVHIDPFGSILLPLMLAVTSGAYIAYARPVPYNPSRLKKPGRDDALVALAGPLANLAQACLGASIFRLVLQVRPELIFSQGLVSELLLPYVIINISLMLFNLLPLPPLDGSKLLVPFLHGRARERYYHMQQYALPILLLVLYLMPEFLGIDPVGDVLAGLSTAIMRFLLGV